MTSKSVDIIIPIYNAADDLEKCLQSIFKHTDLSSNRLVLINDASPDPRIKKILDGLNGDSIVVIHNDKNNGFSANINLGMSQSDDNDVILLNSDTIVTEHWVEKMVHCAYSSPEIGTVTPLSNNATLCSVPVAFAENQIPEGYSIDEIASAVEQNSLKHYPQISVAHGFCMFIKREVIKIVGGFDAKTFGRGYGEENDFCNRMQQLGFINVQCDDTYIFHSGTKSFISEEKQQYIREHEDILRKRYPVQMHENDIYVRDNPNGYIAENITPFIELQNGKKNLLYILHYCIEDSSNRNIGGTEIHVKQLKDELKSDYNVFVAARKDNMLQLTLYIGEHTYNWAFFIGEEPNYYRFYDRRLSKIWANILDGFSIDIVHIHHLKGLSLDIAEVAKERNIPLYYTCHDYFAMCPFLTMIDSQGRVIDSRNTSADEWKALLESRLGVYQGVDYIDYWHRGFNKMLKLCDKIIVPSNSVKNALIEYFPELQDSIQIIEHGYCFYDTTDHNGQIQKVSSDVNHENDKNLKVAFLGGLSLEKGGKAVYEIIKQRKTGVDWLHFGTLGYDDLSDLNQKNFIKFGPYDRNDLPELLSAFDVDLVCILSICPESFSYTLSEAILCNCPVIVTDVGALGERASKMDCCKVVSVDNTVKEVLEIIDVFSKDEQLLNEYKERAKKQNIQDINSMLETYKELYESIVMEKIRMPFDSEFLFQSYLDRTSFSEEEKFCAKSDLRQSLNREQLDVLNSTTYKIAKKIKGLDFPFKRKIWRMLNK